MTLELTADCVRSRVLGMPICAYKLLDSRDMKGRESDATTVIKPDNDSVAARIDAGMVSAWHVVAVPAAGNDRERLERPRLKVMADIFDHRNTVTGAAHRSKTHATPNAQKLSHAD